MAGNGKSGDNRRHGYVGGLRSLKIQQQGCGLSVIHKQDNLWMKTSGGKFEGVRREKYNLNEQNFWAF